MKEKKLYRSKTNKLISGVCGGIGEYLGVDPTIVRVGAVILGLMSAGTAAIIYIVLIWAIPEEPVASSDRKKVDSDQR